MSKLAIALVAATATLLLYAPGAGARLLPLHARVGDDPAIVDSSGSQVLLHGVAVNQLGDYYRVKPGRVPVFDLRRSDFVKMHKLGFNVVRLVMSWSGLEPRRSQISARYLRKVHRAVRWARGEGIYVILDMHQDAWGKSVATAPGESCVPPLAASIGWDGAPHWASHFDGLSRCHTSYRELSPAVAAAFDNFYADTNGIQSQFDRVWRRIAKEFASNTTVAGFDLFNEPHPGTKAGPVAEAEIGSMYKRAIEAIRKGEDGPHGGFRHLVFFEPDVFYDVTVSPADSPLPGFASDRDVVFSPHLYPGTFSPMSIDDTFAAASALRASYGAPMFVGEWGFYSDDPRADRGSIENFARDEDGQLASDSWWLWRERCGDPHIFYTPDSPGSKIANGLNRYSCPGNRPTGIPTSTRRVLSRSYARSAPGRIIEMRSDPTSKSFELTGKVTSKPSCRLRVWTRQSKLGRPAFEKRRIGHLRTVRRPGGWVTKGCPHGSYRLTRTLPG